MSEGKRHLRTRITLGALVILVAMIAWVLLGTTMMRR